MKHSILLLFFVFIIGNISLFGQSERKAFSKEFKFVDHKESIADLLELYKGTPVLIDIFSVYCRPCIKEFKYKEQVDEYLIANGIKKLYIVYTKNFEDDLKQKNHQEKWKSLIEKYKLKGDHYYLMNTDPLYNDIQKDVFKGKINLPWYVIINKDGEIVNHKAPPCSKFNKLKKELEEIL